MNSPKPQKLNFHGPSLNFTVLALAAALITAVLNTLLSGSYPCSTCSLKKDSLTPEKITRPTASKSLRVTVHHPGKTFRGYTLLAGKGNIKVKLVDMEGVVVNEWPIDSPRSRLLPNGNLLALHGTNSGVEEEKWEPFKSIITEYDWDGNVVWENKRTDIAHHDIRRLPNGNTIFLQRTMVPEKYKARIKDPLQKLRPVRSDLIVELDPQGKSVWEWPAHEYLDLNSCGAKGCALAKNQKQARKRHDWTHLNTVSIIPENKWYQQGHKEFKPGNIMTLPRSWWTAMIIDKDTKKVVWTYTGDYRGGLSGGHEPIMIKQGYPGAGNIILFDNGRHKHSNESIILEINPVTKEPVWIYEDGPTFFSEARGAVHRLKNGNTLISDDNHQRCFEVTPEKEIVWSYKESVRLNRCHRYPLGYTPQLRKLEDRHQN